MATVWERAAHSVDRIFSLYFDYLLFYLFSVLVLGRELVLLAPVPGYCILVTLITLNISGHSNGPIHTCADL